jgi:transposase-like protein
MNSHPNARLGFAGRLCLVQRVLQDHWTAPQAAAAFGISDRTVRKWLARYRVEGGAGLRDRSSRPRRSPRQLPPALERRSARLRAQRRTGPQIADTLGLPLSTVGDVLRRLRLGRLPPLVPRPPIVRYERATPGELLHIDVKKLGRIASGILGHRMTGNRAQRGPRQRTGWEYLHVAVDDASRVASAALLPDESAASAVTFLQQALAWLATLGIQVRGVMTDNAFCYTQRYTTTLRALHLRHRRTRPYPPVPARHQWEGRALHPDRLARGGLCQTLSLLAPAGWRPRPVLDSLQYHAPSHGSWPATTDQSPLSLNNLSGSDS